MNNKKLFIAIILIAGSFAFKPAQANTINGSGTVETNTIQEYSYHSLIYLFVPSWDVDGGEKLATWNEGTTYYLSVRWTTPGTKNMTFDGGGSILASKTVTVVSIPSTPGTPSVSSNTCGDKTLTRNAPNESGTTWYWQNSATGRSTVLGSDATKIINSSGTWYTRGKNALGWGSASAGVSVTVSPNQTWYRDLDGDGFGDGSVTKIDCTQPSGFVSNDSDCEDDDDQIHPNTIWYVDNDGDGYGVGLVSQVGCEQPADHVLNADDCDDTDPTVNPTNIWYRDNDGDGFGISSDTMQSCLQPSGYTSQGSDCDDTNIELHPETLWYRDADGDSYGTILYTTQSCTQPTGYVADNTDCNDDNSSINPTLVWYEDSDSDGFGNAASTTQNCTQPSGYVSNNTDCDDDDITVNPNKTWYRDADGDGYGTILYTTQSCIQPTGYVADNSDCEDANWAINPGTIWYEDSDGDGYGDFLVSQVGCEQPAGHVLNAADCNDTDAAVNPTNVWYRDNDGDGFGISTETVQSCTQPQGYASNSDDCDDGNASLSPITTWYLDKDDDGFAGSTATSCNDPGGGYSLTVIPTGDYDDDNVLITNIEPQYFFEDEDGDGYGNPDVSVYQSHAPTGYVSNNSDYCLNEYGTVQGCPINERILSDANYVYVTRFKVAEDDPDAPMVNTKIDDQITYLDGLGRKIQENKIESSPLGGDLVYQYQYDEFGRSKIELLPYVKNNSFGSLQIAIPDVLDPLYSSSNQFIFYNSQEKVALDAQPYSDKVFENSPLNRVLKQGAPGSAWQPDSDPTVTSDKIIRFSYETNVTNEVTIWDLDEYNLPVANGTYSLGELYKNTTEDEEGNRVVEFVDKQGQTILKNVETGDATYPWAQTYYVYDDFGNLSYVLPPMIFEGNETIESGELDNYAFQYHYDSRKRMVEKKVPGSGWVYMVYDKRDRLVLTQDANQRLTNQWTFTKYDHLNRPVSTGFYTNDDETTRTAVQNLVNTNIDNTYNWYESKGGSVHGYDNASFPDVSDESKYLTVTYYDDYAWNSDNAFDYNDPTLTHVFNGVTYNSNVSAFSALLGQITGAKVKNLATNTWMKTVSYYDDRYRVIQTISDNNLGAKDNVSNLYDFTGKVLKTETEHGDGSNTTTILRTFDYDHADRLLTVKHKIDSEAEIVILENEYNELGELVDKKLHSSNGTDFLQSVDYRYNIRGWLTSMNNATLTVDALNDENNDYFGFELAYNDVMTGVNNTQAYNGNISAMAWSDFQGVGSANERAYSYSYDAMNRLTGAQHHSKQSNSYAAVNDYSVSGLTYDLNGNIESLVRNGKDNAGLDNLVYSYASGNQLSKVDDSSDKSGGFKDGENQITEYSYDVNGNMVKDLNKGIDSIYYNHLNLPMKVDMGDGDSLVYQYDAAGIKLKQEVYEAGTLSKTTDYIGEYIYEDGILQFIQHEEGRIVPGPPTGTQAWDYQYHLKDHLGNVRTTFSSAEYISDYIATFEDDRYTQESQDFFNIDPRVPAPYPEGDKMVRLNNTNPIGPALGLQVTRGDTINMSFTAYYEDQSGHGTSSQGIAVLAAKLSEVYGGVAGGTEGQQLIHDIFNDYAGAAVAAGGTGDDSHPAAYLNYLVFDSEYNLITEQSGFVGIDDNPGLIQTKTAEDLAIEQAGFIYIYLSNESNSGNYVYFDDFEVNVKESPVLETTDYYPFGLTFGAGSGQAEQIPVTETEELLTDSFDSGHEFVRNMGDLEIRIDGKLEINSWKPSGTPGRAQLKIPTQAGSTVQLDFYFNARRGSMEAYLDDVLYDTYSVDGDKSITFTGTGSEVTLSFKMASGFDENRRLTRCRIKNFKATETLGQTTTTLMNYDFSLNHGFVTIGKGGYTTLHSNYRGSDVLKLIRPNINKESIFRRTINGTTADSELLFEFDIRGLYGELEIFIGGESKGIFTEPQDNVQLSHTGNGGDIYIDFIFNTGTVNNAPSTVYLDNLTVTETVEVEGEYTTPYSPYYKPGMVGQNFKYQGQEHISDLGLNWDQFKWRNSDPTLGRFFNLDPLAEKFYYNSPYAFSENKVTNHIELEGLEAVFAQGEFRASGPLVGAIGVTGSVAVGVALDTKGNIGVYYTLSGGPQVGGGITAGVSGGANLNADDIYSLEGFGVNAGGFLTTSGVGVSKSAEINLAIDTNMEAENPSEVIGDKGITSGGFTLGSNYSVGVGASAYVDVSLTKMIGSFDVKNGLEGVDKLFLNTLNEAGVNPEDLGINSENVSDFIQSIYANLNNQLNIITESQNSTE